jgi:hypothetical protein
VILFAIKLCLIWKKNHKKYSAMADQYTEITRTSWGTRIKESIKGILLGVAFIIGGIILLFWNEGRTVNNKRALNEGEKNVISIESTSINETLEGKLIHTTGFAQTIDTLYDSEFGISQVGISLHREVEMYQWEEKSESETDKKVGGAEETKTTYTYVKKWSSSVIKSEDFKVSDSHTNPVEMAYDDYSVYARNVTLGAFVLPESLVRLISNSRPLEKNQLKTMGIANASITEKYLYIGKGSLSAPQIGDLRINFKIVEPQNISIIAKQTANSFEPYTSSNGNSLMFLESGTVSAELMFQHQVKKNKTIGWVLRLLGFLLISGGFGMILKPLKVLADVVPFIGSIVGIGTGLISGILGFAISFIVIAIGWIFYRPVLGISLLVIGIAALVYFFVIVQKRKKQ